MNTKIEFLEKQAEHYEKIMNIILKATYGFAAVMAAALAATILV